MPVSCLIISCSAAKKSGSDSDPLKSGIAPLKSEAPVAWHKQEFALFLALIFLVLYQEKALCYL